MNKGKVLIVDDCTIILRVIKKELEEADYEVTCVESGKEAIELTKKTKYDVVLIDYVMPELNGVETCKEITKLETGAILVLMTGSLDDSIRDTEKDFIASGGNVYYLYKPFDNGEVLGVVERAIEERVDNT
ncbi:MAG: response regulator [Candidatus Omnitrophica bacterium]|nr:response regulator [Candidatus Omnitrophota bacterium]MBU1997105.1 response regulator [Candidatus Omnitrophota bacterium]MBU4334052.1 response regulator [Candidatus Omnitrophota bacterium]